VTDPNVEIVRELYERINSDDRESIYELLSEDFRAVVPPSLSAEPDVYVGHAGVRRYMDGFQGHLEDVRFEVLEFLPEEGERVIADMLVKGRGAASGIPVEQPSAVLHTIVDGKVARMDVHVDVEAARGSLREVG
jgi:ketosteroid isomerase-like protein